MGRNIGDGTTEEATVTMTIVKDGKDYSEYTTYGRWIEKDGWVGGAYSKEYSYETAADGGVSFGVEFAIGSSSVGSGEYTLKIEVSYGNFTFETAEYTLVLVNF